MIVASSAQGEKEIQRAHQRLNQLSQEQQIALAKSTNLDTPRMSDLREKLRFHQEQQREVVDTEKQKNDAQKERQNLFTCWYQWDKLLVPRHICNCFVGTSSM